MASPINSISEFFKSDDVKATKFVSGLDAGRTLCQGLSKNAKWVDKLTGQKFCPFTGNFESCFRLWYEEEAIELSREDEATTKQLRKLSFATLCYNTLFLKIKAVAQIHSLAWDTLTQDWNELFKYKHIPENTIDAIKKKFTKLPEWVNYIVREATKHNSKVDGLVKNLDKIEPDNPPADPSNNNAFNNGQGIGSPVSNKDPPLLPRNPNPKDCDGIKPGESVQLQSLSESLVLSSDNSDVSKVEEEDPFLSTHSRSSIGS
jgi:hypothetical protein